MFVVVSVNLSVTLKADRNGVIDRVGAAIYLRVNVVKFHLKTTESMANAASSMTMSKQLRGLFVRERHLITS
jgi:hypothetical protein